MTRCSHCGCEWTGFRQSHCTQCHHTFSGLSAFDAHQDGIDSVFCLHPKTVGLEQKSNGIWGQPITEERKQQLEKLRGE